MWLVPIRVSIPFTVSDFSGKAITPALFISTSHRSYFAEKASTKRSMLCRS